MCLGAREIARITRLLHLFERLIASGQRASLQRFYPMSAVRLTVSTSFE
jgi:hypothetical protein